MRGVGERTILMMIFRVAVLAAMSLAIVMMDDFERCAGRGLRAADDKPRMGVRHPASRQHCAHKKCDQREMAECEQEPLHRSLFRRIAAGVNLRNVAASAFGRYRQIPARGHPGRISDDQQARLGTPEGATD